MTEFARATRLDPDRAIEVIAAATGCRLTVEGRPDRGEVGAAYVRWPDGRRSVLGIGEPAVEPLLVRARAAGVPAPEYQVAVPDDDLGLVYLVQTRLDGAPPLAVDTATIEQMLSVHARMAGLLADRDMPTRSLFLRSDGPGFCLHEPLAREGRRAKKLLAWIEEVGREVDEVAGDDLVHFDFHTGNVLMSDGVLTGVVDWDGAARGDGGFDLITLRFDLARVAPELTSWFDEVIAARVPAPARRAYWAHMSLRQVDWSIRHHSADDVEFWLDVASGGMA